MKKVLILFGGNSYEHEISCKSVNFVIKNIDKNLFDYTLVGIDFNNDWFEIKDDLIIDKNWIKRKNNKINNIIDFLKNFDIVFPVIHGYSGEDGKLQSLFELYNIKYVGCDSIASIICYDKLLTKLILEKYAIPQVPYMVYNENMDMSKVIFPVIIKPCKCGSSIGISIANNKKELKKAIKNALKFDNNVIIEKFIKNNRELECAILEDKKDVIISDIGEIISNGSFYSYDLKYKIDTKTSISNIENNIKDDIKKYSKSIFKILNCKGISRIDYLYDNEKNKLYFNEINTIPGLTNISMYPILMDNIGIDGKKLITKILNN